MCNDKLKPEHLWRGSPRYRALRRTMLGRVTGHIARAVMVMLVPTLAFACAGTEISGDRALARALKWSGDDKSGAVLCLAPGRYSLRPGQFTDAFVGIDPARPLVVQSADPNDPAVLNRWLFGVSGRRGATESGHVILRDLTFEFDDARPLNPSERGFSGHRTAIVMGVGGPTRNVTVERVTIRGPLGEARLGAPEMQRNINGIEASRAVDVVLRDNRIERVVNGIMVSGEGLVIEGNRMRHSWGDFLRISPQVLPDGGCAATADVTVTRNMAYDFWANNRLHPDFIHLFASHGVACDVQRVTVSGNLVFPGTGMDQPGHPTRHPAERIMARGQTLSGAEPRLYRVSGPGTVVAPPAQCEDGMKSLAVQLDGTDTTAPTPVRVLPSDGDSLRIGRNGVPEVTLVQAWEAWRLLCSPKNQGVWQLQPVLPSIQGVFSNPLPDGASYKDITVQHNILWINAPAAVSFRGADDTNVTVQNNTFLRPWPGDRNRDGVANTPRDGVNTRVAAARIYLAEGANANIAANIATGPRNSAPGNVMLPPNGAGLEELFGRPAEAGRNPRTPQEAVALARPAGSESMGAAAVVPARDPVDWSWVATPW